MDLFHVLYCSGSMCVGVTVWFGWGGVVSLCRLKPAWPDDLMIKRPRANGPPFSQASRRTIGPPTGPQQIVSLPSFDIRMVPSSQPRIYDYPEVLERHRAK